MKNNYRLLCSVTATLFLVFFLLVEYLPLNLLLVLYTFLTSQFVIFLLISMIPFAFYYSFKDKDFGIILFWIIIMTGQFLFVHIFGNDYYVEINPENQKPLKYKYTPYFESIG